MRPATINDADAFEGGHRFLAEELLVPMASRTDASRLQMFTSNIAQVVVLDEPEIPRVFTRFENAFGRYSSSVRKLRGEATVLGVFDRSPRQRVYALQLDDGRFDVYFAKPVRHLTESYGYRNKGIVGEYAEGDVIPAGTVLQHCMTHDSHGNFRYGVNLSAAYMNLDGLTYEDGVVVSQSAAEKMAYTSVDRVFVMLNRNDFCVNLYGSQTEGTFQGFPEVGEQIKNGVLLARRRINREGALFDLSTAMLSRVNPATDTVFYMDGTVMEIEVFSNLPETFLEKHVYTNQILRHHQLSVAFRDWYMEVLGDRMQEDGATYTDDAAFWLRVHRDSRGTPWKKDRVEFDGVGIMFTVAQSHPLQVGSKVTNRYGGKGVVSEIRPDDRMPRRSSDGARAEIVVNNLGVVNRINPSQWFENELNRIAEVAAERMAAADDAELAKSTYLRLMEIVSPDQAAWLAALPAEALDAHVAEIVGGDAPIRIFQPPFFGIATLQALDAAYAEFNCGREPFDGIEEPVMMGKIYYLRLKHEPSTKMSARSAKHLSIAGVPAKHNKGTRTFIDHHSTTPIRFGEQETTGLLLANCPEALDRFLRMYATDGDAREALIRDLLTRRNVFSDEPSDIPLDGPIRPVAGLKALLETIGLEFEGLKNMGAQTEGGGDDEQ